MSKIVISCECSIYDGMKFSFRTPCNCTDVDGLTIKYRDGKNNEVSKTFIFADTHGENIIGLGNLFATGVIVEVILDVTNGRAFILNSGTNSYHEAHKKNSNNPHNVTAEQVGAYTKKETDVKIQDAILMNTTEIRDTFYPRYMIDDKIGVIDDKIGDVDTALDELHNYARSLIGGEA